MTKKYKVFLVLLSAFLIFSTYISTLTASNDKNWIDQQKILTKSTSSWSEISISNIRNFDYKKWDSFGFEIDYYDKTFDLDKITSLDFILVPFAFDDLIAHSFLSFWFEDWSYISFSIEWRKEKWESYSPFKGLFRKYELIYIVWDEKDLIDLRVNYDKDKVYLYPIKIDKEMNQKLFLSLLERVNYLEQNPEFYNTLFDSCTVSLWKHLKEIWSEKVWLDLSLLFPWLADKYLFKLWLIDTDAKNIEELRKKHLINNLWEKYENFEDFSLRIRNKYVILNQK